LVGGTLEKFIFRFFAIELKKNTGCFTIMAENISAMIELSFGYAAR